MIYEPETPSGIAEVGELAEFIVRENRRIAIALSLVLGNPIEELHAEPVKLREWMTVAADGTNWNPGSGRGVYTYYTGAWHKLG